jgi:hypothetical protein
LRTKEEMGQIADKTKEIGQIADQGGDRPNCRPISRRLAKLQTKKEEISQSPKKEN